jgi:hypothetical protein
MNKTLSLIHSEIAKLGAQFNPDILASTRALYSGLVSVAPSDIETEFDIAYGPNPRQTLDLYGADPAGDVVCPWRRFNREGGRTWVRFPSLFRRL